MLKAEQVPDEAVVSAREAWLRSDKTAHEDWRDAIAAALNAWPGLFYHPARPDEEACIFLPLPQEPRDE